MHILQHKQNANAENFREVVIEFLGMEFDLATWRKGVFQFVWVHFLGKLEYQIKLF